MNFQLACYKRKMQEIQIDAESFGIIPTINLIFLVLDSPMPIEDHIDHHLHKYLDIVKDYYVKAKEQRKLKFFLAKKPHLQEHLKKPLLNFFFNKSTKVYEEKIPFFLVIHNPNNEEDTREYRLRNILGNSGYRDRPTGVFWKKFDELIGYNFDGGG
jgi:hypothetical protein